MILEMIMESLFKDLGYDDPKNETLYFGATMDGIFLGSMTLGDAYPLEDMKMKLIAHYCSDKQHK